MAELNDTKTVTTFGVALKLWLRLLLAGVMCFIVYVSMIMLGNAFFSTEVGYQIVEVTGTGEKAETTVIGEYRYKENELPSDHKKPELAENQRILTLREMTPQGTTVLHVITQIGLLFLVGTFAYGALWELGDKDDNRVRYNGITYDKWRGLKVGLLTTVPAAVVYAVLLLCRFSILPESIAAFYRFLNTPYLPYINWLFPATQELSEIPVKNILLISLTLLPIPLVSCGAYLLGYNHFSAAEHITYKSAKKQQNGEI